MSIEADPFGPGLAAPLPLRRSIAVQARVIRALLLRELITRFGRRNLGVLWLVVEPALFTLAVAGLWTLSGLHQKSDLPIIAFAITGYSSVLLWRNTVGHCVNAIAANRALLYHRNVRALDVLVARWLLEFAGASASFAVLTAMFVASGSIRLPVDPLRILGGWLLLAWFAVALGVTMAAATAFSEAVARFWQPVSYILFPLSGAVFMVAALPPAVQQVVLLIPMVHGVEMVRGGYFGDSVTVIYDAGYLASFCLVLSVFGLLLLRLAAKRTEIR